MRLCRGAGAERFVGLVEVEELLELPLVGRAENRFRLGALEACDKLAELGLDVGVFNMRWAKPLDAELVREAAKTGHIFTLEDNSVVGGFGSGVLETLSELGELARVTRIGLPDDFVTQGSVADLDKALGLDAAGVAATIGKALGR